MNILIVILVLCLIIPPIYFRVVRFNNLLGIILFVLGSTALFLRLSIVRKYPLLGVYNPTTFIDSLVLCGAVGAVFIFFSAISSNFKKRKKALMKLTLPYLFFGVLQQMFFYWVFADVAYYLSGNLYFSFVVSLAYFVLFHLNWKGNLRKFLVLLFIFALINNWVYLIWKNVFPQMVLFGLVGSFLFTVFTNTNQLKRRLG